MNVLFHLMAALYGLTATGYGAEADMCANAAIGYAHVQVVFGKAEDGNLARVVIDGKEGIGDNRCANEWMCT